MKLDSIILEYHKFGIKEIVIHVLYKMGIVKWDKVYSSRLKYYTSLDRNDYKSELEYWYKRMGGKDDIENPTTFNGKIQWLKLYDSTPEKTRLADKYLVREWVKDKLGDEYLINILGVYDSFGEIDFDELPSKFVIKANHGSGMNIIVKDKSKLNMKLVKKETSRWMNTVFGYEGMEIHYFDIPRKILIEEYIEEMNGNLFDYKIHCFNGEPKYIQVIGNRDMRHHTAYQAWYDLDWKLQNFTSNDYPKYKELPAKPSKLGEMIKVACVMAEGFKYVRVDLYLLEDDIKFGEMTFTSGNGFFDWSPAEANGELGKLIDICE